MLMQYSYDNATSLLELLKENKIACLRVDEKSGITAIEYTLISDLSQPAQEAAQNILAESLTQRLYLIKLWHDFIVSRSAGRNVHLEIKFNSVRATELEFYHNIIGNMIYSDTENTDYERAIHCLESLDMILTRMGVSGQQLVNVYRREGSGRSKKYIPLTLQDLLRYIRKAVE